MTVPSRCRTTAVGGWNTLCSTSTRPLESGPDLDQMAPDFKLPLLTHDAEKTELVLTDKFVKLSDSRGKRPVVLIFGSFT